LDSSAASSACREATSKITSHFREAGRQGSGFRFQIVEHQAFLSMPVGRSMPEIGARRKGQPSRRPD